MNNESKDIATPANANKTDSPAKPSRSIPIGITIALITLAGTLATALFGNWEKLFPSKNPSHLRNGSRYLIIHAVKPTYKPPVSVLPEDSSLVGFRIGIDINGDRYSFPTRFAWANPAYELYPAPITVRNHDEYLLNINGFAKYEGNQELSFPTNRQTVERIQWVEEGVSRRKWAGNGFEVDYEITD